jgi:predicted MFS family arabinose efflux permease
VLNAARACQGVGAALQLSAALAILSHAFSGAERARAFAFWGMVVGIAITLGPVAGGAITQEFGWEWAFYVNIPVGVGLIFLVLRTVAESADPHADRVDFIGFVLFSGGVFALTLALITGNARGWSSAPVLIAACSAAVLLAGFLFAEARQRRPMVDLRLFGRSTFLGANVAALAFAGTLLTMLTYLPMYFQSALGFGPRLAGLGMLPLVVPLFIVPQLVARHLVHRLSGRALLTAGLSLVTAGLVALGIAVPFFSYTALIAGMVVAGTGAGILNGEVVKVGMTVIPPARAGMASGVAGTVRFTGIVIGFAALGAVLTARIRTILSPGLEKIGQAASAAHSHLVQRVVAGDVAGAVSAAPPAVRNALHSLILASFGTGFQTLLFTAASFAAVSGLLTWVLVRREETEAVERKSRTLQSGAFILME